MELRGLLGLETSVSLGLDRLVNSGLINLKRFVDLYSVAPARILGLGKRTLEVGAPADLTVFSDSRSVVVDPTRFRSLSRNTPYGGMTLSGSPLMSIVSGGIAHTKL